MVFLMFTFVFRINAANRRLEEANAQLASMEDESADLQRALIEISGLNEQILELEEQIAILTAQIQAAPSTQNNSAQGNSEAPSNNNQNSGTGNTADFETYTVQQGDSLSRISQRYYGTPGEYRRIMEANNLTNTNIFPGQVLRIPPR